MGSLVGESLDLKTIGLRSRKKRVGLSGRCPRGVPLTTLLSPTGGEGNLSAEGDSGKSREPHSEVGFTDSGRCRDKDEKTTVGPGFG